MWRSISAVMGTKCAHARNVGARFLFPRCWFPVSAALAGLGFLSRFSHCKLLIVSTKYTRTAIVIAHLCAFWCKNNVHTHTHRAHTLTGDRTFQVPPWTESYSISHCKKNQLHIKPHTITIGTKMYMFFSVICIYTQLTLVSLKGEAQC